MLAEATDLEEDPVYSAEHTVAVKKLTGKQIQVLVTLPVNSGILRL